MKPIYMIIGVPAAGKSWVAARVREKFEYLSHDIFGDRYLQVILARHASAEKPLLIETPFSISELKTKLEGHGKKVIPLFIFEDDETLIKRYKEREGKDYPKGNLTRQKTFRERCKQLGARSGTSMEIYIYLRDRV